MADNPIRYEDLFSPDLTQKAEELARTIDNIKNGLASMRQALTQWAQSLLQQAQASQASTAEMQKMLSTVAAIEQAMQRNAATMKLMLDAENRLSASADKLLDTLQNQTSSLGSAAKQAKTSSQAVEKLRLAIQVLTEETAKGAAADRDKIDASLEMVNSFKLLDRTTDELKQAHAELRKAYSDLTQTQKENSEEGQAYAQAMQEISETVKEAEERTKALSGTLANLTEGQLDSLRQFSDALNAALNGNGDDTSFASINEKAMSYNELAATYKVVTDALKGLDTAEREYTDTGNALTDLAQRLDAAMKDLAKSTKASGSAAEQAAQLHGILAKLSQDELQHIQDLQQALQQLNDELRNGASADQDTINAITEKVKALDLQQMSYNEMYATYNKLKDSLNAMTLEERESTTAGRTLTVQARQLYETMNKLQQETGKYTMQVGKYKAAFDGLGFSFMQILREAPSALNLDQFFLAISNNIPLFMDQVDHFYKKMKADMQELQDMQDDGIELTDKQQEQLDELVKATSGGFNKLAALGKKLIATMWSMQGAVLAITMIIRNWSKIVDWLKKIINNTKEWYSEMVAVRREMRLIEFETEKSVAKTETELKFLINDLKEATKGSEEYANAMMRVKEITNDTKLTTNSLVEEVEAVTAAYIEQRRQIAANNVVVERMADLIVRKSALGKIADVNNDEGTFQTYLKAAGLDSEDQKDAKKDFDKAFQEIQEKREALDKVEQEVEKDKERVERLAKKENTRYTSDAAYGNAVLTAKSTLINNERILEKKQKEYDNAIDSLKELADEYMSKINTEEAALNKLYNDTYKGLATGDDKKGRGNEKSASGSYEKGYDGISYGDIAKAEAEAYDAFSTEVIESIKRTNEQKRQLEEADYLAEKERIEKEREDKWQSYTKDLENAKIYVSKYGKIISSLDAKHVAGEMSDEEYSEQKAQRERQLADARKTIANANKEREKLQKMYGKSAKAIDEDTARGIAATDEALGLARVAAAKKHSAEMKRINEEEEGQITEVYIKQANNAVKGIVAALGKAPAGEAMREASDEIQQEMAALELLRDSTSQTEETTEKYAAALRELAKQKEELDWKLDKKALDAITAAYNRGTVAVIKRVSTVRQEQAKNSQVVANIKATQKAIDDINAAVLRGAKGREEAGKEIDKLTKKIGELRNSLDFSRQFKATSLGDTIKSWLTDISAEGRASGGGGLFDNYIRKTVGDDVWKQMTDEAKQAVDETILGQMQETLTTAYSLEMGYVNDIMNAYVELAEAKVEAAKAGVDAAQEAYDKEKSLLDAGYANRVESAWAELQEQKEIQKQAEAEARRAAQAQEAINTAQEASELAVAVAKIFKTFAATPAIAAVLSGALITTFLASKAMAMNATKQKTYGQGTAEMLVGGSHASGHDISLGYDSRGYERRAEGGEVLGIVSRRAVRRYGRDNVLGIINGLNRGTYEGTARQTMLMEGAAVSGAAMLTSGGAADLRTLEQGVGRLVEYGGSRTYVAADGSIVKETPNGRVVYKQR